MAETDSPRPGLARAIARVADAGQRALLARLELFRFDLAQAADRTARAAPLVVAGFILLTTAWCALMASAVLWLHRYLSLPASLALIALLTGATGAGVVALGLHSARAARPSPARELHEAIRGSGS